MATTKQIERFGAGQTDDYARLACRNAPQWVRRGIDRNRVAAGLQPLWPIEHRQASPAADPWCVLVGPCCPGKSMPVTAATDGLHLPEIVMPGAFDRSLRAILAGKVHVKLEAGHGGEVLASTKNETLTFSSSPNTGLMAAARVQVGRHRSVMLSAAAEGTLGLSVSMLPRRMEIQKRGGRQVRVIHEADLKALACLWNRFDHGQPAYRSARMFFAFESDKAATKRAMRLAAEHAQAAMLNGRRGDGRGRGFST